MYSLYLREIFCIHSTIFGLKGRGGGRGGICLVATPGGGGHVLHIIAIMVSETYFEMVRCWEDIFCRNNFAMDSSKYYLKYYFKCGKIWQRF